MGLRAIYRNNNAVVISQKARDAALASAASTLDTNEILAQLVAEIRTLNAQVGWQNTRLAALDAATLTP